MRMREQESSIFLDAISKDDVSNVCKVLPAGGHVQFIVFFAAIREILKREIYRGDKDYFLRNENKGPDRAPDVNQVRKHKSEAFNL